MIRILLALLFPITGFAKSAQVDARDQFLKRVNQVAENHTYMCPYFVPADEEEIEGEESPGTWEEREVQVSARDIWILHPHYQGGDRDCDAAYTNYAKIMIEAFDEATIALVRNARLANWAEYFEDPNTTLVNNLKSVNKGCETKCIVPASDQTKIEAIIRKISEEPIPQIAVEPAAAE